MYVRPTSTRLLRGMLIPAMRAMSLLALTLLVPRVLADHEDRAVAADDLALLAHRLDRWSYLHDPFRLGDQRGRLWPPFRGCRYRSRTRAYTRSTPNAQGFHDSKGPAPCRQPSPSSTCQGVSTRGPSAVMAMVNSKWAASEPSWE